VTEEADPIRRQTAVCWDDDDFVVRTVTIEDLIEIQRDNVANGWSRRWSSEDALLRQVVYDRRMFLCPCFRNGGPVDSVESYRCWLWFVVNRESLPSGVTLLTVGKALYETLPAISTVDGLKQVVLMMFAGVTAGCNFEPID
jgi:hypothetical protein